MTEVPALAMNDGREIPQLGFGTWQIERPDAEAAVAEALRVGYRLVDTAAAYGNEREVGAALRGSGIAREELFVTTKLWNAEHGRDRTLAACERSLGRLGLDYLDLYLIHWPLPMKGLYVETWKALEELRDQGLTRSIGVSNFTAEHLDRLADETGTVPAVNQVECHPRLQQTELRAYHAEHGILTQGWSPLAQGQLLDDPVIGEIAEGLGRTPAQVLVRWQLEIGNVVIPKSVTPERIAQNFDVFGFELDGEAMSRIAALDSGERTGGDPDTFDLA